MTLHEKKKGKILNFNLDINQLCCLFQTMQTPLVLKKCTKLHPECWLPQFCFAQIFFPVQPLISHFKSQVTFNDSIINTIFFTKSRFIIQLLSHCLKSTRLLITVNTDTYIQICNKCSFNFMYFGTFKGSFLDFCACLISWLHVAKRPHNKKEAII